MGRAEAGAPGRAAAVVEVGSQHLELEVDQRFEQAGFDMGAGAADAAPHQGGEDAVREGGAGQHVGDGEAEGHRPLIVVAVEPHDAGARLRQKVLTGPLDPRALVAVAGDRGIDDAGIDRPDRGVVEPEALDDAGPEILQHDVGLADQLSERGEVGRVLEVEREAFLGAVDGVEDGRIPADLGVAQIDLATEVAAVGPLDLDDAGAEVLQAQRGVGSGEELAEVDDDQSGQRGFLIGRHGDSQSCSVLPAQSAGLR